jgi:hypothetical protein
MVTAQRARPKRSLEMGNEPSKVSYSAMLVALIAAIAVSSIWYSPLLFGKLWRELNGANPAGPANTTIHAWKILIDLVREFFVIYVLARLVDGLGIVDWKGALNLGFWVWLGFPVQMLVGASLWDNKPWTLDLIHAGDWLIKMLLIAIILAKWPRVQMARLQTSS